MMASGAMAAVEWNAKYGPGTPVRVRTPEGNAFEAVTRSMAYLGDNRGAVIKVRGIADELPLDRVTVVQEGLGV